MEIIFDIIGLVGVVIIVGIHYAVQLKLVLAGGPASSILNALGSGFILISLYKDWNLSAATIQVCWIIISILAICKYYKDNQNAKS